MGNFIVRENPEITGNFNAHSDLKKCELLVRNKSVPWCNVLERRYNAEIDRQELCFQYIDNGKICEYDIMFDYGKNGSKVFDQVHWNDRNCPCKE